MKKPMDKEKELVEKIQKGLVVAYEKMVESKRRDNGEIVIMKGDKIMKIKP